MIRSPHLQPHLHRREPSNRRAKNPPATQETQLFCILLDSTLNLTNPNPNPDITPALKLIYVDCLVVQPRSVFLREKVKLKGRIKQKGVLPDKNNTRNNGKKLY